MVDNISIARDPSEKPGGYDRVVAFIREQLTSGQLKSGDRLLPERELACTLGVSRPVVREALRAMAAIGAMEIRPGHGTIVRRPDLSRFSDFFSLALAQEPDALVDVMEVRIAIERHAVRLACQRASEADHSRLTQAYERIVDMWDDVVGGWHADYEFHLALVEAAHSPSLSSVYEAIADLLKASHRQRREDVREVDGISSFVIDHHAKLLNAVLESDERVADQLLVEHFEIGAEFRRKAILNASLRSALRSTGAET